ncbi:MAG: hypothetical protein LBC90_04375 [Candidatus Adiutrix sp.]|jgi:hypothetical protein|nr:hypothetical protein [Candidatus Adiutrix sp.]
MDHDEKTKSPALESDQTPAAGPDPCLVFTTLSASGPEGLRPNRVKIDIERLNSFYVAPQVLFRALHYAFSQPQESGASLNCLGVLTPSTQFMKVIKEMDNQPELKAGARDELRVPVEVLATRSIALMRLLADYFIDRSGGLNQNRLKAELDKLWPRREFITAASFTPLKNYANGTGAPFFDPGEFLGNVSLIKNSIGKHLGHFPWGPHSHHS